MCNISTLKQRSSNLGHIDESMLFLVSAFRLVISLDLNNDSVVNT